MPLRVLPLLLAGQAARAGLPPPRMYPWDRVRLAERAYSGEPWGTSPRTIAALNGIRLAAAPLHGCGGEIAAGGLVLVSAHRDPRELALRQWHGLAHVLLAREAWAHSESDVWLLTLELAVPRRVADRPDEELLGGAHAPAWAIRRWLPVARSLGRQKD